MNTRQLHLPVRAEGRAVVGIDIARRVKVGAVSNLPRAAKGLFFK
jgi:hypothetical protein